MATRRIPFFSVWRLARFCLALVLAVGLVGALLGFAMEQAQASTVQPGPEMHANITDVPLEESGYLYWARGNTIYRVWADGTHQETLLQGVPLRFPAFTADGETMYGIGEDHVLRRANTDGTEITALLTMSTTQPHNLRLDEAGGKLYWTGSVPNEGGHIRRANLDGSEVETLATDVTMPLAVTLYTPGNQLYWIDGAGAGSIRRVHVDGGAVETVFANDPELRALGCLSIDPMGEKVYWQVWDSNFRGPVMRADLDGSNLETLPLDDDVCPTLDVPSRKLYWRTVDGLPNLVQRSNLDGTDIETLYVPEDEYELINDLLVDSATGYLYWRASPEAGVYYYQRLEIGESVPETIYELNVDSGGVNSPVGARFGPNRASIYWEFFGAVQRISIEGGDLETVIAGAMEPRQLLRNPADDRIYWADVQGIRSVALDGSDTQELLTVEEPLALTLDASNQRLYWVQWSADENAYVVQRSTLDGPAIEEVGVLSGLLDTPFVFDLQNATIYGWQSAVDESLRGVARANLDGANQELIVPIPFGPANDFALDVEAGHLYWIRGIVDGMIQRADLDGENVTELVTGLDWTSRLAVDTLNAKIYWVSETEEQEAVLWRANLDGSGQELFLPEDAWALFFDREGTQPEDEEEEEEEEEEPDPSEPTDFSIFAPTMVAD